MITPATRPSSFVAVNTSGTHAPPSATLRRMRLANVCMWPNTLAVSPAPAPTPRTTSCIHLLLLWVTKRLRTTRVLSFALVPSMNRALTPGFSHRVFRIKPIHCDCNRNRTCEEQSLPVSWGITSWEALYPAARLIQCIRRFGAISLSRAAGNSINLAESAPGALENAWSIRGRSGIRGQEHPPFYPSQTA